MIRLIPSQVMSLAAAAATALAFDVSGLPAQICRPDSVLEARSAARPANYVFFRRDRGRTAEPSFLDDEHVVGAQLTFTWRELEPERDRYDFDALRNQLAFLRHHGKRLVVQLQDDSFSDSILVPAYLIRDTSAQVSADPTCCRTPEDSATTAIRSSRRGPRAWLPAWPFRMEISPRGIPSPDRG